MGRVVKCPICEWRGFLPYYFLHWQKNHEREGYLPPEKVDSEGMDSRPIDEKEDSEGMDSKPTDEPRGDEKGRRHEVKVHNVSRGRGTSASKR